MSRCRARRVGHPGQLSPGRPGHRAGAGDARGRGAWIGWTGDAGPAPGTFGADGLHLVGLALSETEVRCFYEGFCNATLWPLYHDVIAPPQFHRRWWEAYVTVNRRNACWPSSGLLTRLSPAGGGRRIWREPRNSAVGESPRNCALAIIRNNCASNSRPPSGWIADGLPPRPSDRRLTVPEDASSEIDVSAVPTYRDLWATNVLSYRGGPRSSGRLATERFPATAHPRNS
jgi:Glycosyltransferase family 20